MSKYQQLNMEERERIREGLWGGRSLRAIAFELQRSPATISRELKRNCPPGERRYVPGVAEERAKSAIKERGRRHRLKNGFIRTYVHSKLAAGYSPEQIAGRLSLEYPKRRISHEAIYQYIYSQYRSAGSGRCIGIDLRLYLRRRHKVRKPKHVLYKVEKGSISNRVFIDERPKEVERRKAPGHWEGDSMVSRKSPERLNTMVERVSGLVLISKLKDRTSRETANIVVRRLQRIPQRLRKTLTLDSGPENAKHEQITERLHLSCFFAHPYHSWERGTNENTNGLIRWYLPKGTDFADVPESAIQFIEQSLNTRPRKRLKWRTPLEVFNSFVLH